MSDLAQTLEEHGVKFNIGTTVHGLFVRAAARIRDLEARNAELEQALDKLCGTHDADAHKDALLKQWKRQASEAEARAKVLEEALQAVITAPSIYKAEEYARQALQAVAREQGDK